jgi:hypothetical protein
MRFLELRCGGGARSTGAYRQDWIGMDTINFHGSTSAPDVMPKLILTVTGPGTNVPIPLPQEPVSTSPGTQKIISDDKFEVTCDGGANARLPAAHPSFSYALASVSLVLTLLSPFPATIRCFRARVASTQAPAHEAHLREHPTYTCYSMHSSSSQRRRTVRHPPHC